MHISVFDLKRLESYSNNLVDFHLIMDLCPTIARLYFIKDIIPAQALSLSYLQATILIAIGLQHKPIESLESDLNLQSNQLLAQFNKSIRKFTRLFKRVFELDIGKKLDEESKQKVEEAAKALDNMQSGLKQKMADELQDNKSKLESKMQKDKAQFYSQVTQGIRQEQKMFEQAMQGKDLAKIKSISLPKIGKRQSSDDEELQKVEKSGKSKSNGKKEHKRQKTQ